MNSQPTQVFINMTQIYNAHSILWTFSAYEKQATAN